MNTNTRVNTAAVLLATPYVQDDVLCDKVFALAAEIQANYLYTEVEILIDTTTPVVALNDKVRDENPELKHCPTVNEVRDATSGPLYQLFSGGAMVRAHVLQRDGSRVEKYAVLQRDSGAPTDKGFYTGPAGRCGEYLSRNSVQESDEEIVIISGGKAIAFAGGGISEADAIAFKQWQVKKRLGFDIPAENVRVVQVDTSTPAPGLSHIVTKVEGNVVDEVYGLAFYDNEVNTLEVRCVVDVDLDGDAVIMDGEGFGRNAAFYTLDELEKLPMVYALAEFVATQKNSSGIGTK